MQNGTEKHWGFFVDGVGLKIWVFGGFIPKNPRKKIEEFWGQG